MKLYFSLEDGMKLYPLGGTALTRRWAGTDICEPFHKIRQAAAHRSSSSCWWARGTLKRVSPHALLKFYHRRRYSGLATPIGCFSLHRDHSVNRDTALSHRGNAMAISENSNSPCSWSGIGRQTMDNVLLCRWGNCSVEMATQLLCNQWRTTTKRTGPQNPAWSLMGVFMMTHALDAIFFCREAIVSRSSAMILAILMSFVADEYVF
jgi:hypothetical protein